MGLFDWLNGKKTYLAAAAGALTAVADAADQRSSGAPAGQVLIGLAYKLSAAIGAVGFRHAMAKGGAAKGVTVEGAQAWQTPHIPLNIQPPPVAEPRGLPHISVNTPPPPMAPPRGTSPASLGAILIVGTFALGALFSAPPAGAQNLGKYLGQALTGWVDHFETGPTGILQAAIRHGRLDPSVVGQELPDCYPPADPVACHAAFDRRYGDGAWNRKGDVGELAAGTACTDVLSAFFLTHHIQGPPSHLDCMDALLVYGFWAAASSAASIGAAPSMPLPPATPTVSPSQPTVSTPPATAAGADGEPPSATGGPSCRAWWSRFAAWLQGGPPPPAPRPICRPS